MNQMDFLKSATLGILLLVTSTLARDVPKVKRVHLGDVPSQYALDPLNLPENVAVYPGESVAFTCWISEASLGTTRVQWIEYTSNPNGEMISDGDFLLQSHPDYDRYRLIRNDPLQYDLVVLDIRADDAGTYTCMDTRAPAIEKNRHSAQLVVVAGQQNCTTTIPASADVLEGVYYTTECILDYQGAIKPKGHWEGPQPFGQAQTDNGVRAWSGMSFYAHRTMSGQLWRNTYNFTDSFHPVPGDSASNIPDLVQEETSPRITVHWTPQAMSVTPKQDEYKVGDVLECFADAFPAASYIWHVLETNERLPGSLLTIPQEWEGTVQELRCQAINVISGTEYSSDFYVDIFIPGPTTTPTTTTPTTTTLPPPVSNCLHLAGRWESVGPTPAYMCLEILNENGNVHGVLRNDTETFWIDLVGVTDVNTFDHASFTGIWPLNRAVSTFIGECSRCHGKEHLLINAVSRTKGGPPCATPGEINYSLQYDFVRNPDISCPPITIPPSFDDDEE